MTEQPGAMRSKLTPLQVARVINGAVTVGKGALLLLTPERTAELVGCVQVRAVCDSGVMAAAADDVRFDVGDVLGVMGFVDHPDNLMPVTPENAASDVEIALIEADAILLEPPFPVERSST